jgi:phosphatidylglycerol:prolipoprotein diacylglycerol transferase
MFPKLITITIPEFLQGFLPPQFSLYSYGFMIALGAILAFYIVLYQSKSLGLNTEKLSSLFMWAIGAAFVGGKLFFFLEDINKYWDNPSLMKNALQGGFVFYGSLIFTLPTLVLWLKKEKIAVRPFLDILAFAVPVLHSMGRVGCFLAGCCHGKVCSSNLGVVFSHPDTLADFKDVPLYPTQLFDIGVNVLILGVVYFLRKRQSFQGQLFLVYLIMYAIGRSIVELYRGDDSRGFLFDGQISHSQFIALFVIVGCSFFWYKWRKSDASLGN